MSYRRPLQVSVAKVLAVVWLAVALGGCSGDSAPTPPARAPQANLPPAPPPSAARTAALTPEEIAKLPKMLPDAEPGIPSWAGQQGEPFDVKQFLESRAAPADNAAPLYFAALADVSSEMSFVYPPAEWQTRLPKVQALGDSIATLADPEKLRAAAVAQAEIERVLADAQPALRKLDQAQQKPHCVFIAGLRMWSLLPHAQVARQFGRLGVLQLYHARLKGDFDEAEQAVRRTLRLSRDLRPRGGPVNQLVSITLDGMVLSAINDFTLSQPNLDAKHCDRLLALLGEHQRDPISPAQEALRGDYIVERNSLDDLKQGRISLVELLHFAGGVDKAPPKAQVDEFMKTVNWETEVSAMNLGFAAALATAARPYHEVLPTKWEQEEVAKLKAQDARVTRLLFVATGALLEAAARSQATMAGTQCLIAVRRYVLAHGAPPADLDTAIRQTNLPAVPTDPYSGQPMRYKVLNGKPIVYSVGKDQKDDGGVADWKFGQQPGDFIFQVRE